MNSKIYKLPTDRVVYNYRYFLPYAPEWGTVEFCQKRLNELLEFCQQAEIDAVQFFVNTLPGTYYMPAHDAAEQEHWARWMKERVAPALRQQGVSYQLNLQMILGAQSYGVDMRDEYDWEFMVNQYGNETLGCACPLSPVFRKKMGEMLRLWAGTEPDIIWIDDDFRMHNHGLGNSELDFYCYCKRHLDEFALRNGRAYRVHELVAEVLRPGKPSPVRLSWLDFLDQTMNETAAWIRQQIHAVSPRTRLAQMTSAPDVHSAEGRNWKDFMTALCGEYPPITRPCSGVYTGTAVPVKDQTITFRFMYQSIAALEQTFGPNVVEYGPELENTRFTTWCKSVVNTEFVLLLGQLLGCPQITLSMNDLEGSAISDEPTTVPVLRDNKFRLQTLAEMHLRQWQPQGVIFICDPESARKVHLHADSRMQDLGLLRKWEDILLQMGIPGRYLSTAQAAKSNEIVVLERYTAWCASDAELKEILSGSVLLDGEAAEVIQQRGFGEYLGVTVGPHQSYGVTAEVFQENILPGLNAQRVPHRGVSWYKLTLSGANLVSWFIDAKNHRHVGSTIYENRLGGRVAILAASGDFVPNGTFGNHARLRWLHGILRWLSREQFCLLPLLPHHGLTLVRSKIGEQLVALANLGTDVLNEIRFRLPLSAPLKRVNILDKAGQWQDTPCDCHGTDVPGVYFLTVPCHLNVFEWLIISWTEKA